MAVLEYLNNFNCSIPSDFHSKGELKSLVKTIEFGERNKEGVSIFKVLFQRQHPH